MTAPVIDIATARAAQIGNHRTTLAGQGGVHGR